MVHVAGAGQGSAELPLLCMQWEEGRKVLHVQWRRGDSSCGACSQEGEVWLLKW